MKNSKRVITNEDGTTKEVTDYIPTVKYNDTSVGGVNNNILKIMQSILSSPHTLSQQINPGGFDNLKHLGHVAYIIDRYINNESDRNLIEQGLKLNFSDPITIYNTLLNDVTTSKIIFEVLAGSEDANTLAFNIETIERNTVGKQMVAMFANFNTLHVLFQMYPTTIKGEYAFVLNNKMLDTFGNISRIENGEVLYLTKVISEYLAAAVDNGKDPVLGYNGLSLDNVNMVGTLLMLGYTQEEVMLLMSQPASKRTPKTIAQRELDKSFKQSIRDGIYTSNGKTLTISGRVKGKYVEGTFAKLNKEDLIKYGLFRDGSEAELFAFDYEVERVVSDIRRVARNISKLSTGIKFDTFKDMVSNFDIIRSEYNLSQLYLANQGKETTLSEAFTLDTNILPNPNISFDELISPLDDTDGSKPVANYMQTTYSSSVKLYKELFSTIFPELDNTFSDSMFSHFNRLDEDTIKQLVSQLQTYYLSGYKGFSNEEALDYIYNFPTRLSSIVSNDKVLRDNKFIQLLSIDTTSELFPKVVTKEYLKLDVEDYKEYFKELIDTHPELVKDLVKYDFYVNQLKYSPKGYLPMIPVEAFDTLDGFTQYMSNFLNTIQSENFDFTNYFEQFKDNNPLNPMFSVELPNLVTHDSNGRVLNGVNVNFSEIREAGYMFYPTFVYNNNIMYRQVQHNYYERFDLIGNSRLVNYNFGSYYVLPIFGKGGIIDTNLSDVFRQEILGLPEDPSLDMSTDESFLSSVGEIIDSLPLGDISTNNGITDLNNIKEEEIACKN